MSPLLARAHGAGARREAARWPRAVEAARWPGIPQGEAAAQAHAGPSTGSRAGQEVSHGPRATGTLGTEPAVLCAGVSCARGQRGLGASVVPWPGSSQALENPDSGAARGWAGGAEPLAPLGGLQSPYSMSLSAHAGAGGRGQGGSGGSRRPAAVGEPQPHCHSAAWDGGPPRREEDWAAAASWGGKDSRNMWCLAASGSACHPSARVAGRPPGGRAQRRRWPGGSLLRGEAGAGGRPACPRGLVSIGTSPCPPGERAQKQRAAWRSRPPCEHWPGSVPTVRRPLSRAAQEESCQDRLALLVGGGG